MDKKKKDNKGTYCLVLSMEKESNIKIGAKGKISFKKGHYVYVGSALNSLTKRIERHISKNKKKHWHIDYLLMNKNAQLNQVIYTYSHNKIECDVADEIFKNSDEYIELFGCSDCNCRSHLYYFKVCENAVKTSIETYKKMGYKPYKWFNDD